MISLITAFNGIRQRSVPDAAPLMKPEGAMRQREAARYSGKGGVSPSGNATWNTFSMFPISV